LQSEAAEWIGNCDPDMAAAKDAERPASANAEGAMLD
jgi:hypothetical protein